MNRLIMLTLIIYIPSLLACDGFLPPNKLYLSPEHDEGGLSKLEYERVIRKFEKVYAPIAKEHGAVLKIDRKWSSGTVNAGTYRDAGGSHWHVNLYGGLPRHQFMTEDGYTLVLCHEIGHHIGGAPKKIINEKPFWSSTEGQADYWATLKCLRRIFKDENNEMAIKELDVPAIVSLECAKSFSVKEDADLCIRMAMAGKSLSRISASVRATSEPLFETPDLMVVPENFDKHPLPQCRLDSYFQGALCPKDFTKNVSQENEVKGTCHPENDYQIGMRPLCWFRPQATLGFQLKDE